MSEFICPKSGESCEFYHYCASRKETLEAIDEGADWLAGSLPEPIAEAMNTGFCANERIEALADVAERSDIPHHLATNAVMLAAQLQRQRDMFPTATPESV
jgi:hypothetical protein